MHINIISFTNSAGQFAELAYCESSTSTTSSLTIPIILQKIDILTQTDFPLEGYDALLDCTVITSFSGKTADLSAFVLHRPSKAQLVVGVSGTKTLTQVLYDINSTMRAHPSGRGKVHAGFWALYLGIKTSLLDGLRRGLQEHSDIKDIIFTGHSMGGAIAYLFVLDLLTDRTLLEGLTLPRLKIAAFGSPRAADTTLSNFWHEASTAHRDEHGADSLMEYSVKAYNDGKDFFSS